MDWMWDDELLIPELDVEIVAMELIELCNGIYDDESAMERMLEAVMLAMILRDSWSSQWN